LDVYGTGYRQYQGGHELTQLISLLKHTDLLYTEGLKNLFKKNLKENGERDECYICPDSPKLQ